jgi:hypothetical protein
MRCSPKLCVGLILIGIAAAALLTASGYVKAATLVSFLPLLACPVMCAVMMMFGRTCDDGKCETASAKKSSAIKHP